MKRIIMSIIALSVFGLGLISYGSDFIAGNLLTKAETPQETKMPDVIVLAKDAKLGAVTFNHADHTGKNYKVDGSGPLACVECHHTAQPAEEVAKHPPLKTAWPADRKTTLTAELFAKDPAAAGAASCRSCHARAGETPKLLPKIPDVKKEGSDAVMSMTNQQAFHRNCAGCHDAVVKAKPESKAPTTAKCMMCHKKGA